MTQYEAVCFDMDGVLVDTEPHWHDLWQEVVFPEAVSGEPTLDDVTGRSYPESLRDLDAEYGLERDVAYYEDLLTAEAASLYTSDAGGPAAVHDLFDAIRDRGVAVAVVSSAPRAWIEGVVDRFDLGPLDALVSAEAVAGPGKPAPEVYEHAAAELGVDPSACVVVEDSGNGVRSAAAAGATVIRYACSGECGPLPGADAVADDPAALERILFEYLGGT